MAYKRLKISCINPRNNFEDEIYINCGDIDELPLLAAKRILTGCIPEYEITIFTARYIDIRDGYFISSNAEIRGQFGL